MNAKLQALTANIEKRIRTINVNSITNENPLHAAGIREILSALTKIRDFDVEAKVNVIKKRFM